MSRHLVVPPASSLVERVDSSEERLENVGADAPPVPN